MDSHLIELQAVGLEYSTGGHAVRALDAIDLTIDEGEFVALVGPSGSGKTSLLNLIGGLDRPTVGTLRFRGSALGTLDDEELSAYRSRQVGFVFQAFHLHPGRTALENISVPLYFSQESMKDGLKRGRELLNRLGLQGLEHRPVSALSGGQRQRVAVVRALVNRPALLLADEPIGSLDHESAELVIDLLLALRREEGLTVVAATHDDILMRHASRIVTMASGRLVEVEVRG